MQQDQNVRLLRQIHKGSHMAVQGFDEVIKDMQEPVLRQSLVQMQNLHKEVATEASRRLQAFGDIPEEPHVLLRAQVWANEGLRTLLDRSEDTLLKILLDGSRMGLNQIEEAIDREFDADGDTLEFTYRYRDQMRRQLDRMREMRRIYH